MKAVATIVAKTVAKRVGIFLFLVEGWENHEHIHGPMCCKFAGSKLGVFTVSSLLSPTATVRESISQSVTQSVSQSVSQ